MKNVFPLLLVKNSNGTVEFYRGKLGLEEGATAPSQGELVNRMTDGEAAFEFEIVDVEIET